MTAAELLAESLRWARRPATRGVAKPRAGEATSDELRVEHCRFPKDRQTLSEASKAECEVPVLLPDAHLAATAGSSGRLRGTKKPDPSVERAENGEFGTMRYQVSSTLSIRAQIERISPLPISWGCEARPSPILPMSSTSRAAQRSHPRHGMKRSRSMPQKATRPRWWSSGVTSRGMTPAKHERSVECQWDNAQDHPPSLTVKTRARSSVDLSS